MLGILYSQISDRGQLRENNEDSYEACVPDDPHVLSRKGALFVIADGLGGLADGEVASRSAALQSRDLFNGRQEVQPARWLREVTRQVNKKIYGMNCEKSPMEWMATTLTLCLFQNRRLHVGHVGDCRVYRVRGNTISCLTQDHTIGRHTLTRAIGTDPKVEPDLVEEEALPGDLYVQCSDGLYSMMAGEELQSIVTRFPPRESCEHLAALANERGGPDNITVQVIRLRE